mgnify:CR=1 FL=1
MAELSTPENEAVEMLKRVLDVLHRLDGPYCKELDLPLASDEEFRQVVTEAHAFLLRYEWYEQ